MKNLHLILTKNDFRQKDEDEEEEEEDDEEEECDVGSSQWRGFFICYLLIFSC